MMALVSRRIGLIALISILVWISVTSLHPGLYLIGWDNYSSYLTGVPGMLRTIFSTWRAYRGIGVPSDSESTDLFRQLFTWGLTPFINESLVDQVYILACLWLGVLGIYALAYRLVKRYSALSPGVTDVASAIGASFYLLNLNTLATFYFPIITYITRFGSLPLLLLAMDVVIHAQTLRFTIMLGVISAIVFSSGSFITATVFFTTLALLLMFIVCQARVKRGVLALSMFLLLNMFWLLPFMNYTIQKSSLLRLAPVFVDTNETQLNLSPSSFGFMNQLVMFPNFFHTTYTTIDSRERMPFHSIVHDLKNPITWVVLLMPISLALAVMGRILLTPRRNRALLWIPGVYGLFLILSTQEFSSLGFIFALLNKIPYFSVVFRFGDTKFHPYLSVTGSIALALSLAYLLESVRHSKIVLRLLSILFVTLLICIPGITVYRAYLNGNFLPKFLFVSIPSAYREVAQTINGSFDDGRVLHLPYDPRLYWRSHTWGYMGSAFYQYLLTKPYMDKTFEPGSLETTEWYRTLTDVISDANQTTGKGLEDRADKLFSLLEAARVSWVVLDESVSPEVRIRNMRYWGVFNLTDSQVLLDLLEKQGKLSKVTTHAIPLDAIRVIYESTLHNTAIAPIEDSALTVYRVPLRPFYAAASRIHSLEPLNSRIVRLHDSSELTIQSTGDDMEVQPMIYKDQVFEPGDEGFMTRGNYVNLTKPISAVLETEGDVGQAISVIARRTARELEIEVQGIPLPDIGDSRYRLPLGIFRVPLGRFKKSIGEPMESSLFASNWHVLGKAAYSDLRIAIDGVVLPVPPLGEGTEEYLGAVLVTSESPVLQVFQNISKQDLSLQNFRLTDQPNCFGDAIPDYRQSLDVTDVLNLESTNGTTCILYPLDGKRSPHTEFEVSYEASSEKSRGELVNSRSDKPNVARFVQNLDIPNQMSVCLATGGSDTCSNTHSMIRLAENGTLVIPQETDTKSPSYFRIGLVPIGEMTQKLVIKEGTISYYDTVYETPLVLNSRQENRQEIPLTNDSTLRIPYLFSRGSYFGAPNDGYAVSNRPCELPGGYRTTRLIGQKAVSYLRGCYNEISVQLPFDSRFPKIWAVRYAVHAGKYPTFILEDPFSHYVNEYLSLYQGYPTVRGMLSLQRPEQWYHRYSQDTVARTIGQTGEWASVMVPARPELTDTRPKSYTVHQDSQNEGIMTLEDVTMMEIPASWERVTLRIGEPVRNIPFAPTLHTQPILPSLTKIDVNKTGDGSWVLEQAVGYDRSWVAYKDLWSAVLGIGGIPAVRCNDMYNCYTLDGAQRTWYLLFTPERLAVLGWLISLVSAASFLSNRRKFSRT